MKRKKGFGALVKEGFDEKITIRAKGRRKRVSRMEVIVLQQVMQAVRGEKSALKFVLTHLAEMHTSLHPLRIEYRNTDGSKEVIYRDSGKVKHVDADGAVTWYKDRQEYHSRERDPED